METKYRKTSKKKENKIEQTIKTRAFKIISIDALMHRCIVHFAINFRMSLAWCVKEPNSD